jgi:D-inositol-3-phosphate glycosyltransferase
MPRADSVLPRADERLYQRAGVLGKKARAKHNESMRVAMLSYHTCPLATLGGKETGGMNVYVRELTRHLGRRGIGVDVFTRSQDDHVPHVLHDLGYGNRIVHVRAGPETPVPKDRLAEHLPEYVEGIRHFASGKGLRYDLIHSHYWLSGLAALDLSPEWGAPIIQMFHTLGAMKNRVARSPDDRDAPHRFETELRLLREADRVVASTPAEIAQFNWLYKVNTDRVTTIPPGVDTSHFYPIPKDEAREYIGAPPDKSMLLFVGRIEPLKGLETLLEAIALLVARESRRRECYCLAVIGGDPDADPETMTAEMSRMKELRSVRGISDMVRFLGKRDQDTLQYYYSAADIVIVPSQYESFGLVALEAMACGTPVVASETGGLAFLVKHGETGYHVPTNDPAALAEKLELLLDNQELRLEMGRMAAAYAGCYDWANITEEIVELYQTVLKERLPQFST